MTLAEVRKLFVDTTGRFDLVVDTVNYVDNGADHFIQRGQDFLDRLPFAGKHGEATLETTLSAGGYLIESPAIRAVKQIYVEGSEGIRYLTKMLIGPLREYYGDIDGFPNLDTGTPVHFATTSVRKVGAVTANNEINRGVFILPPVAVDTKVVIQGLFDSAPLVDDNDVSYWSIEHPNILMLAAWYELELYYRNRTGAQEHLEAIQQHLQGLDFDEVEEDIAAGSVMRDSWRF